MNKIGTDRFERFWQDHFPAIGPVAYLMRGIYSKRWIRIHSLPESKRYPETEKEKQEILKRHLQVASYTLGNPSPSYLSLSLFNDYPISNYAEFSWYQNLQLNERIKTFESSENLEDFLVSHISEVDWNEGDWRSLILDVAEDRAPHALFICKKNGRVYAPYDGGADIFLENEDEIQKFKSSFADWLSPHEHGL